VEGSTLMSLAAILEMTLSIWKLTASIWILRSNITEAKG
jgi:hypothetical protein